MRQALLIPGTSRKKRQGRHVSWRGGTSLLKRMLAWENASMGNRTLAGRNGDAEDVVEARDDITDIAKTTTPLENPDL